MHASCCAYKYFDCVINVTTWKLNVANMFMMLIIWCKIPEISMRKWIQLNVCSQPVKNVWISYLSLILTFWWIELVILRKVYQNFIFYFEDIWKRKFVLPDLNRFFPHWKTCFISSFGRYLIQWRILWVIHL